MQYEQYFPPSSARSDVSSSVRNRDQLIRAAVTNFCDARINSWVFRRQLGEAGVRITREIDRLIRLHESDNSVSTAEIIRTILRHQPGSSCSSPGDDDSRSAATSNNNVRNNNSSIQQRGGGRAAQPAAVREDHPSSIGREDDSEEAGSGPGSYNNTRTTSPVAHHHSYSNHAGAAIATPYATDNNLTNPDYSRGDLARHGELMPWNRELDNDSKEQNRRRVHRQLHQNHAATRTAGDIIGWTHHQSSSGGGGDDASTAGVNHFNKSLQQEMDIITWSGHQGGGQNDSDEMFSRTRSGKRCYNPADQNYAAPFGTEADHNKTAEECGTHEFRAANWRSS